MHRRFECTSLVYCSCKTTQKGFQQLSVQEGQTGPARQPGRAAGVSHLIQRPPGPRGPMLHRDASFCLQLQAGDGFMMPWGVTSWWPVLPTIYPGLYLISDRNWTVFIPVHASTCFLCSLQSKNNIIFKYKRWCSKTPSYLKPDRKFTGIARKAESVAAWKSLLSQLTAAPSCIIYHFSPFRNYLFALMEISEVSKWHSWAFLPHPHGVRALLPASKVWGQSKPGGNCFFTQGPCSSPPRLKADPPLLWSWALLSVQLFQS